MLKYLIATAVALGAGLGLYYYSTKKDKCVPRPKSNRQSSPSYGTQRPLPTIPQCSSAEELSDVSMDREGGMETLSYKGLPLIGKVTLPVVTEEDAEKYMKDYNGNLSLLLKEIYGIDRPKETCDKLLGIYGGSVAELINGINAMLLQATSQSS